MTRRDGSEKNFILRSKTRFYRPRGLAKSFFRLKNSKFSKIRKNNFQNITKLQKIDIKCPHFQQQHFDFFGNLNFLKICAVKTNTYGKQVLLKGV